MIVRIQKRENRFSMIDNRPINDKRLSWKARGILVYLLSKPDTWEVVIQDIINQSPDGRDAVRSGFRELEKHGYAEIETVRDEEGKFLGKRWVVYELPKDGFSDDREIRPTGNPTDGKSVTNNTDTSNTDTSNTEQDKYTVSDSIESDHVPDPLKDTGNGKPGENNSAAAAENFAPPPAEFPFQEFWDAYGHKVGRAKSEKKWKRLSRTEKREAMRALPWYVADTVKDDAEQHGDVWRPRRQNPLTWLNGAGWRDYEDADGPMIKDQAQAPGNGKAGNTGPVIRVPATNKTFSITELPD